MSQPAFTRYRLLPDLARGVSELECMPCFAVEVERGAQPGVRVGFGSAQRDAWRESTVALDNDGATVPASGARELWIQWATDCDASIALELTLWHVAGATFARRQAGPFKSPSRTLQLYAAKVDIGAGGTLVLPSVGATYSLSRGLSSSYPVPLGHGDKFHGFVVGDGPAAFAVECFAGRGLGDIGPIWRRTSIASVSTSTRIGVDLTDAPVPPGVFQLHVTETSGVAALSGDGLIAVRT